MHDAFLCLSRFSLHSSSHFLCSSVRFFHIWFFTFVLVVKCEVSTPFSLRGAWVCVCACEHVALFVRVCVSGKYVQKQQQLLLLQVCSSWMALDEYGFCAAFSWART